MCLFIIVKCNVHASIDDFLHLCKISLNGYLATLLITES